MNQVNDRAVRIFSVEACAAPLEEATGQTGSDDFLASPASRKFYEEYGWVTTGDLSD